MKRIFALVTVLVFMCSFLPLPANADKVYDCSTWAADSIITADAIGLIDATETYSYKAPITRESFCELIYNLISTTDYFEDWYLKETKGGTQPLAPFAKRPFDDCDNNAVYDLYNHNIVAGKSETEFAPNDSLTREEAATIIVRMIDIVHPLPATELYFPYDDIDEMAEWALPSIQRISNLGLMQGVGDNKFAPKSTYTAEEAIFTAVGVYNAFDAQTSDLQNNTFEIGLRGLTGWAGEIAEFELSEATALAIADDVFLQIKGEDYLKNTIVAVEQTYDEKCFVVTRSEEPIVPGGGLSVTIRKSDGKILRVVTGE